MESILTTLFPLLVGVAGWFYMFYSRSAERLGGVEQACRNTLRVRLRRVGGFVMLLLAFGMYAGCRGVDATESPNTLIAVWIGVAFLLVAVVVLAWVDARMTFSLRRERGA